MIRLARPFRQAAPSSAALRQLHASSAVAKHRRGPREAMTIHETDEPPVDPSDLEEDDVHDVSAAGHLWLRQQRRVLQYMRLIEHEVPQLVQFRKPFLPPGPDRPLVIRSISYGGEQHPVMRKRTIVTPVSRLPLKNEAAIHTFKLLAGPRWSPEPPKDSGVGHTEEDFAEHGYVKISCEGFPEPAMNLKWASDALDRLIEESNRRCSKFSSVPLDTRHLAARLRKGKLGGHRQGQSGKRPTIHDFPQEWLAESSVEASEIPSTQ